MFAVIKVHMDYDYVSSAECVKTFYTEQQATNHVIMLEDFRDGQSIKRAKYIEDFVNSIEVPFTDYEGWREFLAKYFGENCCYVLPKDLKNSLINHLNNHDPKLEDFNPPPKPNLNNNCLFVVELKEPTIVLGQCEVFRLSLHNYMSFANFRVFLEMAEQPVTIPANIPVNEHIHTLAEVLKSGDHSVKVYVVGGAVRDFLFHKFNNQSGAYQPKDMDLTTNLSEEQILARLRSSTAIHQGIKVAEKESVDTFGVVFASVKGSETYEIAPFRKDIGVADGRRPDHVERGTIYDDAMRRDLTINNLYYDFEKGVILDFNGNGQGIEDVKNGVARPVGDPFERFNEDKLRVLRLVRFFSRFNAGSIIDSLDPQTAAAIRQFKNLRQLGITPERIYMEFTAGIKQSQNTASYLNNLLQLGLMEQIFPGLNVDTSAIRRLSGSKNVKVILALLLRNNANVALVLNQLKYPSDIFEGVEFLIKSLQFGPEEAMDMIRHRDKRLFKTVGMNAGGQAMSAGEIQTYNNQITGAMKQDLTELSRVIGDPTMARRLNHLSGYQAPAIAGQDLIKQGFKGSAIGAEQKHRVADDYRKSFDSFQ